VTQARFEGLDETKKSAMPVLFWVCRDEEEERWLLVVEGQIYGEYVNEEMAVLDAIDLAIDARRTSNTAEVWHRANAARLY
jgi:hypothetical protein